MTRHEWAVVGIMAGGLAVTAAVAQAADVLREGYPVVSLMTWLCVGSALGSTAMLADAVARAYVRLPGPDTIDVVTYWWVEESEHEHAHLLICRDNVRSVAVEMAPDVLLPALLRIARNSVDEHSPTARPATKREIIRLTS